MESFDDTAEQARASGRKLKKDIADGAQNITGVAASEVKSLIADVEDLVARIADLKDADVARVRSKVVQAVSTAKESLSASTDVLRRRAQRVVSGADDYVHDSPWQAIGIAAVVGAVVGILASRRS
jgi:ElaB/YqjD/DUF883 family membrane-anchored ribosome-binding protein